MSEDVPGSMPLPAVIDGHNDTLLRLRDLADPVQAFESGYDDGHIDLRRAESGGYAGGFYAMFVPNLEPNYEVEQTDEGYEVPYADPVDHDRALAETVEMLSVLYRLEAEIDRFQVVQNTEDIRSAMETGNHFAIPHIEGAAAVAPDLSNLDLLYAAGIRSIGLTWSRPNDFGEGVPFVYPATPDTGAGLTEAGERLVDACNDRGILCDLAHLNAAGFWDVVDLTDDPLVVTHSSVHGISPTSRTLTDDQIDAVAESDGVIGIQFGVENLREDGDNDPDVPVSIIVDHVEYVADRVGVDHVALGTDFDGCTVPEAVGDVTGLPAVLQAIERRGFSSEDLEAIAFENWLRVLEATWG